MKHNRSFLALALALAFTTSPCFAESPVTDAYLIQPGDTLEISVWREEGLEKQDGLLQEPP